ncbi:hypothetical protein [Paraclostridium sordellii]|nr:hypothetical protein [Paeniclostridium sordellii]CEP86934.1 Uncharacterised protein [[Clostridium] sordellii] [Paeniclostridium sordellii]CEP97819.1 Uncharacterised protein [[Clostridium] sordellii] [Paeniclostridium sordellii]
MIKINILIINYYLKMTSIIYCGGSYEKTCIVLLTLLSIDIGIMVLSFISYANREKEPLLVKDIPNTECQLVVKSTEIPYGVEIYIKSDSEIKEFVKYPISQDLRNIVKGDLKFKWEGEIGTLCVNGEIETAEFKIYKNKETHAFDYEVKTYKNN